MYVHPEIHQALVDIAQATRNNELIIQGASTRSLVLAIPALQARALSHQRDYVCAEDIDALADKIFHHRLEFAPGVNDKSEVIRACCHQAFERLARLNAAG